jgi:heme exporter protein C
MWLIYCSYLLVRRFAAGPQMQTLAAVVAIFGYADVPIVYYSTQWWRTQHPSPVIATGGLDRSMWAAVWWNLAAWLAWGLMVMGFRYAIERRRQLREQDEALRALESTLEATPWKEDE